MKDADVIELLKRIKEYIPMGTRCNQLGLKYNLEKLHWRLDMEIRRMEESKTEIELSSDYFRR